MKNTFGKSFAAEKLEKIVEGNRILSSKVSRHLSDYNHYVEVVSKITDRSVRDKAINAPHGCAIIAPTEVLTLIENLKTAKRRQAMNNKGQS